MIDFTLNNARLEARGSASHRMRRVSMSCGWLRWHRASRGLCC